MQQRFALLCFLTRSGNRFLKTLSLQNFFLYVVVSIQMPFSQIKLDCVFVLLSKASVREREEEQRFDHHHAFYYFFFHAKQNAYHVIHTDMTPDGVGDVECSHPRTRDSTKTQSRWPALLWSVGTGEHQVIQKRTGCLLDSLKEYLNLHGNDLPIASLPHHAVINDLFFFYYFADGTGTQKVLQISKL